ncbi:hypothetical protein HYFRA_00007880 [Hymenoscyphus fraxineus]|uniref:Rhodopsin domain-containing protein n=1 Tax=Hymenoscyphus fraxineus TaxID=746836 RepID=A0A9N9KMA6_9HELO|nr:hypothetical protein HYFRA_00007880 [Hymenoscyphus fraxineus]
MATSSLNHTYTAEYLAEDRKQGFLDFMICFAVLETSFFALFCLSRYKSKTPHGWDTWLMIPAYIICMGHPIVGIYGAVTNVNGKHAVTASAHTVQVWLKLLVTVWFTYPPSVALPRLCILGLYLRIFTIKMYRYATYGIGAIIILTWLAIYICNFTICTPFQYSWDKSIPGGHCIDLPAEHLWISLPNIVTDLAMLLLPQPVIWHLQVSRAQKIGLTITFATFSIGLVTSCLRFWTFSNKDLYIDVTWYSVDAMIWTATESGVYFIAACLPYLRTLFTPLLAKIDFSYLRKLKLTMGSGTRKSGKGNTNSSTSPTGTGTTLTDKPARDDYLLPRLSAGNDQKSLVTCYHVDSPQPASRLDNPADDLEMGNVSERTQGIQVQKSYGISMMPRVYKT